MKNSVIITIPSHPKYLSVVRAATVRIGELYGIENGIIEGIRLAVDEACSNVIKHAYKGENNKKIVIKFANTKKTFEVIIEDNGVTVPIETIKGRCLEDIRPGGLGVHFIKRTFDVFEFDNKKKNGNRLRLIKYMEAKDGC